MWILVANSWMQTPTGVSIHDGVFTVKDWCSALFNPDVLFAFPHMLVACIELGLAFVIGVSAYYLLQNRNVPTFQKAFKFSMLVLVPVAALQIYLGDGMGLTVSEDQPTVLAAMEGHYDTFNKDGSVNTGWHILAWPNESNDGNAWAITIPHVLSLLETHSWDGKVRGLNEFPAADRPYVPIPFYGFRVMVGIGFAMFGLSLWGAYLWFRGRLAAEAITGHRWFLRAAVAGDRPALHLGLGRLVDARSGAPALGGLRHHAHRGRRQHHVERAGTAVAVQLHSVRADGVGRHLVVPLQGGAHRPRHVEPRTRRGRTASRRARRRAALQARRKSDADPRLTSCTRAKARGHTHDEHFDRDTAHPGRRLVGGRRLLDPALHHPRRCDLGAGIFSLSVRDEGERGAIMEAMAGTWDANETWLIVAGGVLFGSFPFAYGSALHYLMIPLMMSCWGSSLAR